MKLNDKLVIHSNSFNATLAPQSLYQDIGIGVADSALSTNYTGTTTTSFKPAMPTLTVNNPTGEWLVRIKGDGSIEFGEGYDPDTASLAFWAAVKRQGKNWDDLDKENAKLHDISNNLAKENRKLEQLVAKLTSELAERHHNGTLPEKPETPEPQHGMISIDASRSGGAMVAYDTQTGRWIPVTSGRNTSSTF